MLAAVVLHLPLPFVYDVDLCTFVSVFVHVLEFAAGEVSSFIVQLYSIGHYKSES